MSTTPNPQTPGQQPVASAPASSNSGCKILLWVLGILAFLGFLAIVVVVLLLHYAAHKVEQTGDLMKKNPVYATAKLAAQFSQDVEVVSSDDDNGTLVIKDKKTGKVMTMKVDPDKKTMVVVDENGRTSNMKFDPDKKTLVVSDDKGTSTMKLSGDGSTGTMEVKGADGSTFKMGANADSAPSWVPVYPGSSPKNSMSTNGTDGQNGNYTFTTSDASDKVLSYYSDALKSAGLPKTSTTTTNQDGKTGGYLSASDDSGKKTAVVVIGTDEKGTEVSVTYASKP